jgi:hypothetical protein
MAKMAYDLAMHLQAVSPTLPVSFSAQVSPSWLVVTADASRVSLKVAICPVMSK